jgi:hypothetical protein
MCFSGFQSVGAMPRKLRGEYERAIYHVMNRGDSGGGAGSFEKPRSFAWGIYPVGKTRAFSAGRDRIATRNATENKPDCRITSAEADLRTA